MLIKINPKTLCFEFIRPGDEFLPSKNTIYVCKDLAQFKNYYNVLLGDIVSEFKEENLSFLERCDIEGI